MNLNKLAALGEKVQAFEAEGIDKDLKSIKWKIQDNFKNNKWTVLFFFPAAFTSVCATEVTAFSKLVKEFHKEGAEVIGASVDASSLHLSWIQKQLGTLDISLISDGNHLISEYFGIYSKEKRVAQRGTFIISPNGILYVNYSTFGQVGRSAKEALRLLQTSKVAATGRMVPCEWQPGEATID